MQNISRKIEQLWAIQSTEAGARPVIYVASSGLRNDEATLEQLRPYLPYVFPPEWDMQNDRHDAPISLALRDIKGMKQRILLHKAYVEQATVRQPGTCFIHVVTNLPNEFSARDAINLWRSDFWTKAIKVWLEEKAPGNTNKVGKWKISTDTTLNFTKQPDVFSKIDRQKIDCQKIDHHLSYVIQAHLSQQQMQEVKPLYITASSDEVAYVISSLLSVIPQQLQKHVTFSTYEEEPLLDPQCWLLGTYSPPANGQRINYTNGDISPLHDATLLPMRYSLYAAHCWKKQGNALEELNTFLEISNKKGLNILHFIGEYYDFHKNSARTKEKLTEFLQKSVVELWRSVEDEDIRANLIDCALIDKGEFLKILTQRLRDIRNGNQTTSPKKAFNLLIADITNVLVQAAETHNVDFFLTALELLESLSPSLQTWIAVLNELTLKTHIIYSDWNARARLLEIADAAFIKKNQEHWEILSSLLNGIGIAEFPRLLRLKIAPEWIFRATRPEIDQTVLNFHERKRLEGLLIEYGSNLVRDAGSAQTALTLFACVISNHCRDKLPILFSILDQPVELPISKDILDKIWYLAKLSSEEYRLFSEHYSRYTAPRLSYILLYPEALVWQEILHRFAKERKREKLDLLFSCLDGLKVHKNLPVDQIIEQLFKAAALHGKEEIVRFFEEYQHDPDLYKTSLSARGLARSYIEYVGVAGLELLWATQIRQVITMLLPEIQLTTRDQVTINSFLHSPVADITTIKELATAINHLGRDKNIQLVKQLANAFIGCIDDAFQLSSTMVTLSNICGQDYCSILIKEMVVEVNALFKSSMQVTSDPEALHQAVLHLALYVHYILGLAIIYDYNQDFSLSLLGSLMHDIDTKTFQLLDQISLTWPLPLQVQWRTGKPLLNPFRQPSIPVDYSQFLQPQERNVYKNEAYQAIKSIAAAQDKGGAKPLALVWLRYRAVFMQHKSDIASQTWQKMKVLSEFYMACQAANAFYPPDIAAEMAILAIVDDAANQPYLGKLTNKEKNRIKKATQRSKQLTPPSPAQSGQPDMNTASGAHEIQSPVQGIQGQWTHSQPPRTQKGR